MTLQKKNIFYSLILAAALVLVWLYRKQNTPHPIHLQGQTMGTTYHITYFDEQKRNLKPQIDTLLLEFNQSLSTYLPDSEITKYNRGKGLRYASSYFLPVLEKSKTIVEQSRGAFDPTVMPLVNAWGFGPGEKMNLDSTAVDSIKAFTGFEKVIFNTDSVWKTDARVQLDFSAIAKGYGVDIITRFIAAQGIEHIFVEIGGEVFAKGKNLASGKPWQIGILDPRAEYGHASYIAYATLQDKAVATSGNYFNHYQKDRKTYTHTIDPQSGYTLRHDLLSASVFADDCAMADAWATALMVMGRKKAVETLEKHPGLAAFLVYSTDNGIATYATQNAVNFLIIHI